ETKVLIRVKRNDHFDQTNVMMQSTNDDRPRYEKTEAKIVEYKAYKNAKYKDQRSEIWYEQIIMLPFECERKFCTLEPDAPKGFSLAYTRAYKEIQFEFIEVQLSH